MFLLAIVLRTRSTYDFQLTVRLRKVSKRMNSHRFDINNYDCESYASNVALHFNSDSHSIADFSFLPIDVVNDEI